MDFEFETDSEGTVYLLVDIGKRALFMTFGHEYISKFPLTMFLAYYQQTSKNLFDENRTEVPRTYFPSKEPNNTPEQKVLATELQYILEDVKTKCKTDTKNPPTQFFNELDTSLTTFSSNSDNITYSWYVRSKDNLLYLKREQKGNDYTELILRLDIEDIEELMQQYFRFIAEERQMIEFYPEIKEIYSQLDEL